MNNYYIDFKNKPYNENFNCLIENMKVQIYILTHVSRKQILDKKGFSKSQTSIFFRGGGGEE